MSGCRAWKAFSLRWIIIQAIYRNSHLEKYPGLSEEVCRELNGSFKHAYYNAAAVMLRRLLETLIIEAYRAS